MDTKTKSKELREKRDHLMQASDRHSKAIADKAKLIGAGETSELIAATLSKLQILDRKTEESGWMTKIRSMIPFADSVEKAEEKVLSAAAKGSTVSEVTSNLMNIVTNKRSAIEKVVYDLYDLHSDMESTLNTTVVLIEEIQSDIDNNVFEKAEAFSVNTLLAELLEYKEIMRENVQTAMNTIQAAQVSSHQIIALQPKLKAQLDDGISILTVLNELEDLNTVCADLEELSNKIRDDNREKAYSAQVSAIERQTKSKDQLLRLENNAKRSLELQQDIQKKFLEIDKSQKEKVEILTRISNTVDGNEWMQNSIENKH